MFARTRSWMVRNRPRPIATATAIAAVAFIAFRVVAAHAAGVGEDGVPLTPGGASLFDTLAQLYVILGPYIVQRVTEWLRTNYPSWADMSGKTASMNVAVIAFVGAVVLGLATRPELALPAFPDGGALLDYASYAESVLLTLVGVLGYFVAGSRGLHDKWKERTGGNA